MALLVIVIKVGRCDCCICEYHQAHVQTHQVQDYIPWLVNKLVKHNWQH
jgi:hypothetical protein